MGPILQLSRLTSTAGMSGAVIGAAAVALVTIVVAIFLVSRRRHRQEVREIVQTLEDLRSGHLKGRPPISTGSNLAVVADAVQRLGHDLHSRQAQDETATERWRALTDATRDLAIITTDTDGDVRSFSAGASQLFGWEEDEVLSRPAAVVFEESAYKDLLPKLARRELRRHGITTRSTLLRRDGAGFPAEVSVRLLMGGSSQPVGFMMVVRDVTDQTRLENELRESERRYRGLVEGLSEGVVILKGGRIVYANPAAERICGMRVHELLQTLWRDRLATRDVLVVEDALAAVEGGRSQREELRCTLETHDGDASSEVRVTASPVEFAGGAAVLLLVQDETAERRIEGELRRNESRLDAVLEATSDGILVLSEDLYASNVQMTNRSFAHMFGLPVGEVLGTEESALLRRLESMGSGAEVIAELIGAKAAAGTSTVTVGDREVQVTVAPLTSRRGERVGRVVACRDISEQRESQRQLQAQAEKLQLSKLELEQSYSRLNEINADLEARSQQLDRLNQELRRLDEMKSNLLGNVSHELQTPLVSIRGYTEMILKERLGPISEEQRKGLTLSLKNIDRLISMIDNLLAFSRTDPGSRELRLTRFELRPVVREVVDLLREKVQAKEVDLHVDMGHDEIWLQADRDKIVQVLLNLLSNAVKFTARRGRIDLIGRLGGQTHATISVRDTGVGIPAGELNRIFDRHYQVERSKQDQREGSGIGLAIVRDILRLHGCTIQVRSEEGAGAEFEFTLPLSESQRSQAVDEGRTESPAPRPRIEMQPEQEPLPVEPTLEPDPVPEPEILEQTPEAAELPLDEPNLDELVPEEGLEPARPDTQAGDDPYEPPPRPRLRIIRRQNNEG